MTNENEEKAQAIVDGLGIIYTECNRVTIKKRLMEMAQWKDEQFAKEKQALIDKACEWLLANVSKHIYGHYTFLKGIMLEEFENAMKEGSNE